MPNAVTLLEPQVKQAIQNGDSLQAIADQNNVSIHTLRRFIKEKCIDVRALKGTLSTRILSHLSRWEESGTSITEAAKELGVSRQHFSNTLRQHGISFAGQRRRVSSPVKAIAARVIELLMTQGGSVKGICKQLGFTGSVTEVRREVLNRGVDPSHYYFAHRRYHDWLILPGEVQPSGASDRLLPARCLLCGTDHTVSYSNVTSGRSRCCSNCRTPFPHSVVDVDTGEIYGSIRSAAVSINALDKYQSILHGLKNYGTFEINGITLQLRNEEQ